MSVFFKLWVLASCKSDEMESSVYLALSSLYELYQEDKCII